MTFTFDQKKGELPTFVGDLIPIGVHRGHDVNARVIHQVGDFRVGTVIAAQVLDQVEHQLSADHLVSVHVGDVLKLRLTWHFKKERNPVKAPSDTRPLWRKRREPTLLVLPGLVGDDHHVELAALHGLSHRVEMSDGGEVAVVLA